MPALEALRGDLERLRAAYRRRALRPRAGIDFASNDYLGLARSSRLQRAVAEALARGVAIGSGGSRLLRGNDTEHEQLEALAAALFGAEDALFFANGYTANLALFGAVPQRGDLIVHDALIHASARDGMRLGRAETAEAAHNDAQAFHDAASNWRKAGGTGRIWLAVESLYSMDGDRAPLAELTDVADRFEANLLIDEAHATGLFGSHGLGLADALHSRPNVITLHTCGKALGCEGALLCGPAPLREFLINRARSFIFSTAPSPLMAVAVREALRIVAHEPRYRLELWRRIEHAEHAFASLGVRSTGSQILPLVIGDDARTMAIAATLQERGFDVRGIRPPTVPVGTSRLRISLTLNATIEDIDALVSSLRTIL